MTLSDYTVRQLTSEELTGRLLDQVLSTFAGALGYKRTAGRVKRL